MLGGIGGSGLDTQSLVESLVKAKSFPATKVSTGTLAVALESLEDQNTKLNENISQVNVQVDQYHEQLMAKFAALEQAMSRTNSLLQSLNANSDARNNAAN